MLHEIYWNFPKFNVSSIMLYLGSKQILTWFEWAKHFECFIALIVVKKLSEEICRQSDEICDPVRQFERWMKHYFPLCVTYMSFQKVWTVVDSVFKSITGLQCNKWIFRSFVINEWEADRWDLIQNLPCLRSFELFHLKHSSSSNEYLNRFHSPSTNGQRKKLFMPMKRIITTRSQTRKCLMNFKLSFFVYQHCSSIKYSDCANEVSLDEINFCRLNCILPIMSALKFPCI